MYSKTMLFMELYIVSTKYPADNNVYNCVATFITYRDEPCVQFLLIPPYNVPYIVKRTSGTKIYLKPFTKFQRFLSLNPKKIKLWFRTFSTPCIRPIYCSSRSSWQLYQFSNHIIKICVQPNITLVTYYIVGKYYIGFSITNDVILMLKW